MAELKKYLRFIIALVFFLSALLKFLDFNHTVSFFETVFKELAVLIPYSTGGLIVVEFLLCILIIRSPELPHWIISSTLVLLGTFNLFSFGLHLLDYQNCGCFGTTIRMSPLHAILKNTILSTSFLVLAEPWPQDNRVLNRRRQLLFFVLSSSLLLVLLTKIHQPAELRIGSAFPKIILLADPWTTDSIQNTTDPTLITFIDQDCEHCEAQIHGFNRYLDAFPPVQLWFLSFDHNTDPTPLKDLYPHLNDAPFVRWSQIDKHNARTQFGVRKTPTMLLFDGSGILTWKYSGEVKHETIIAEIRNAANNTAPRSDGVRLKKTIIVKGKGSWNE